MNREKGDEFNTDKVEILVDGLNKIGVYKRPADREGSGITRRPATKSEIKQAQKVRAREAEAKRMRAERRERELAGEFDVVDTEKPSIWEKIAEDSIYFELREMGDTTEAIDKFQMKRVISSLVFLTIGVLVGFFVHKYAYIGGVVGSLFFYRMRGKNVHAFYKAWKFERQLNFSKFTRLVIPYLKSSGGTTALYTIFNKILKRTDNEEDRRNLYQLMGEMGDDPQNIEPFLDYADRSSGTDMSHLFMSTIFDFQQSTFDVTVIDELGQLAAADMMDSIDEIVNFKLKRFQMFPTKVVMSSFILVAGLGVALMIHNFADIGFSGDMLDMSTTTSETQDVNAVDDAEVEVDGEIMQKVNPDE